MFYFILVAHFLADFVFQSRDMGKNKSSNFRYLLMHLFIQFMFMLPFGFLFSLSNAIIHGFIDWNIWNLYKWSVYKRLADQQALAEHASTYKYWEDHLFYTTIGFDQMLHAITLYALFNYFQ